MMLTQIRQSRMEIHWGRNELGKYGNMDKQQHLEEERRKQPIGHDLLLIGVNDDDSKKECQVLFFRAYVWRRARALPLSPR